MNDLYENDSKMKNFLLMMNLFSMILDTNTSATKVLNKDFEKNDQEVFRGRMSINCTLEPLILCNRNLSFRENISITLNKIKNAIQ